MNDSSGYTKDINGAMATDEPLQMQNCFSNIVETYVSASGHTRLFTATRFGKTYTLKCLKPDFMYTPIYRQALMKELEIGLQLDHPNICRTTGMENVPGLGNAIVMEHVDGETLESLIANKSLTKAMAHKVVEQLASALDYMHSKQIVHRDLKPANIMVTHNGHNVKLIDFSLADSDSFYVLKTPAGTPGYIAPEQFMPDAKSNVQTDTYSFGVVMREMARLTGDKAMMAVADECTRRQPADRPPNMSWLLTSLKSNRKMRRAAAILICTIIALGIFIAFSLHERTARTELQQASDSIAPDGNRAVDIRLWPKQTKQ